MKEVSTKVVEGHLIDKFSIPVSFPAPAEPQEIVGVYELATITIAWLHAGKY